MEVDASVVDARGQAIDDLTVGDFEVLEDGARQEIEIFSHVQLALPRPSPRSSPAAVKLDVVTSRQGSGRIYIVVLDDLHIAQANVPRVKTSVRQFLDSALGPTDLAAVVFTSGRTGRVRPLLNKSELGQILRDGGRGTRLHYIWWQAETSG